MYLSKLDIVGFKSFAQKTSLRFNEGITAVVGPNGCGKCVVGSTLVTLEDGREVAIRELVDTAITGSRSPEVLDDGVLTRENPRSVRIISLNPETFRLEIRPVYAFVRRTSPETLLKVRTETGREVIATAYHPLFTLRDGKLHALRADELTIGTPIAVPCSFPLVTDFTSTEGGKREHSAIRSRWDRERREAGESDLAELIDPVLSADVYWDDIVSIESVPAVDEWVYDLSIDETHNFIANNIIVHNSNVIDSIRWVIGEQKASALRSDKMEEVIFNGAGKRRPLGMAEVSLTIENTRGILPTEYSEVTITRRLFRNGDSEYLLNKTQCRLRDIVDLFMDTGMGANAYSVIELKMIETILSDRADERRRLFDEAAGVTKYKVRRKEALRKLDATEQDHLRVQDIIKEVTKKVGSLERQAKKAEEFSRIDTERKGLEVEIMEREYGDITRQIPPLEESLARAVAAREGLDTQLAEEESAIHRLEREQAEIEHANLEAQARVNAIAERIAALEQERAVAEERSRSLRAVIERAERDRDEAQGGIEALTIDREEIERALVRFQEQIAAAESEYEQLRAEVSAREEELNARRNAAKGSQRRVIEILNKISDIRGREERTHARIESLEKRLVELDEGDEEARMDREQAEENLARLTEENESAARRLEQTQGEFETAQERKGELRAEIDQLRTDTIELHHAINSRQSKIEFLSGLVDQDESVRFLVTEQEWSSAERITVAEAISTAEEYRVAISAALGNAAHYLVVPGFDDAVRGMRWLENNRKGKATFVCLDRLPEPPRRAQVEGVPVIGWASDLCSSADEHARLRQNLLGETMVVETIDQASEVISRGLAEQAVTIDGVLVREGGVVRGGGQRKDEGATIGKREQVERLEREVQSVRNELEALMSEITRRTEEEKAINLGMYSDLIRRAQQELGQVEKRRGQAEYELEYADDRIEENAGERQNTQEELGRLQQSLEGTSPEREGLKQELEEAERSAQELGVQLEMMEAEFAETSRVVNASHVALVSLRKDLRSAQSELERIIRDRENAERMIVQRERERENAMRELEQIEATLTEERGQLEGMRAELAAAQAGRDEVIRRQAQKREEIAAHAAALREERKGHDASVATIHDLEMKINGLRTRAESLTQRAKEELDLVLGTTELEAANDIDIAGLRERLRQIKERIRSLGTVNLLAYEEWMQESERLSFLKGQSEDLINAEKTLINTITEINETAQAKFVETFEKIRVNFTSIFTSLFMEGDEADLKIADGDPLEAQIEIIAKPRGKRPHSIDLLSGGEKTLTAIALLFSIYLVKPSPFCILDEVDAPLDDANIDRFIQLVRRFDKETQFIIVTHNKRTMSAADTMYGVTQEEDGVSKIVSVRFEEKAKRGSASAAASKPAAEVAEETTPAS